MAKRGRGRQRPPLEEPFQPNLRSTVQVSRSNRLLNQFGSIPAMQRTLRASADTNDARASALVQKALTEGATEAASRKKGQAERAKASRYRAAAEQLSSASRTGDLSIDSLAADRINLLRRSAVDSTSNTDFGTRVPGAQAPGTLGGTGFYFRYALGTDLDESFSSMSAERARRLSHATARLSQDTAPEMEHASFVALHQAHRHGGTVHVTPELSQASGVPEGTHVFSTLSPEHVSSLYLLKGKDADLLQTHSRGVNWSELRKTSTAGNMAKAHSIMQGGDLLDPGSNPKLWSYANAKVLAAQASENQKMEYEDRSWHIAGKLSGKIPLGQEMLDLWGERDSNSGILSNEAHTPEDTWMQSIGMSRGIASGKPTGDITPSVKGPREVNPETGKTETKFIVKDPRVDAGGVYHGINHASTVQAANTLQSDLDLSYTVPSLLLQEGAWDGARNSTPGQHAKPEGARSNPAHTAHIKQVEAAARATAREERQAASAAKRNEEFRTGAKARKVQAFDKDLNPITNEDGSPKIETQRQLKLF